MGIIREKNTRAIHLMKPHSKVKVANVFSGLQHEGEDEDEDDE